MANIYSYSFTVGSPWEESYIFELYKDYLPLDVKQASSLRILTNSRLKNNLPKSINSHPNSVNFSILIY